MGTHVGTVHLFATGLAGRGAGLAVRGCQSKGWGASLKARAARPALLTVGKEDVCGPVLGGRRVLKVADERVDRLWRGKKGN